MDEDPRIRRLRDELELALEDALHGQPMSAHLAGSLQLAAFNVLHRNGLSTAQVRVKRVGTGMQVDIRLPPSVPRVQRIVLNVG